LCKKERKQMEKNQSQPENDIFSTNFRIFLVLSCNILYNEYTEQPNKREAYPEFSNK
jgi:hypothetical protein